MSNKIQFKSILDYKLQVKNVLDALVPDIQFSYYAIMNNSSIQTYFNMISMELYGYEYYQILRLNGLEFKVDEKTINLTVLEIVYNVLKQIVDRKLRYSEYIAYDIYILPIRIDKYIHALGYKFEEITTPQQKRVLKLVSEKSRSLAEEISEIHHEDKFDALYTHFRKTPEEEVGVRLALFNQLYVFLKEGEPIVYQKFDKKFGDNFFAEIEKLKALNPDKMSEKEKAYVKGSIAETFSIGMIILLMLSDSKLAGVWKKIQDEENRKREIAKAKATIAEAEKKILLIESKEN
ncbi:hypothetical protein SCLARK_001491 [Spiroplasma clarkii]|uniref:Uncharacterized protein n=1 Tax=Spiroplasma clarkii TaxID=2139 RepID=A0A1Y0L1Z0_9MOLU|nr:hypothetical protein [Spiroplasma clarkii]ARU92006.1 hypothetical protein SCLARK_001491 [Spiroplasma clarkii]ATX71339.1 hypothetical protein SCLAR_v1c10390 [Spiroplasma clarkii]